MMVAKKKAKGTKNCVVKHRLTHENYKDCSFNCTATLRSQKRIKSYYHEMYTKEVNKVTLTSDDDKVLQTFNRIETYPYGTTLVIVCESKRLMVCKAKEKLEVLQEKFEMQITECESEMYAKKKNNVKCF